MKNYNITFVTTHLTIFGGAGKFLMDYANIFCEKGYKITIVAQKINRNLYSFNDKISLIEIGGPLPSNPFYWLKFNKIKKRYIGVLNKLDNDLIMSQHFPTNYFCSKINNRNSLKFVYYCQEPFRLFHDKKFYSNNSFFLKIVSWILRVFFKKYDFEGTLNADEIISNSNFTKKRVKEVYSKDSYVHYIGVNINEDTDKFDEFDLEQKLMLKKNTPIIFTLGLTHHMKGSKELIVIFEKILKEIPEIVLVIGGWIIKSNKVIIKKMMKKLKIPHENIIFYGFIDNDSLRYFYANSTLTFFTALDEPFGLIPLESMANGTPVIAFKEGGPSETIEDDKTGYTVNSNNLDEFAQKAIKLLKNKSLYGKFSNNSIEHVKKNFSIEKGFSDLESIFIKILN